MCPAGCRSNIKYVLSIHVNQAHKSDMAAKQIDTDVSEHIMLHTLYTRA